MTSDLPKVSCLCVTENRPQFMRWLLRGYDGQTYPNRELVIVDGSTDPVLVPPRDDIRVVRIRPRTLIPVKRNEAMRAATGSIFAWFDDDDWQHPRRLEIAVESLRQGAAWAGPSHAWFVDLLTLRCLSYQREGHVIFNGSVFRKQAAASVDFKATQRRGSDTRWLRELAARHGPGARIDSEILFFWICHDRNVSNPRHRRVFPHSLEALRTMVDRAAWGDTEAALCDLRARLKTSARIGVAGRTTVPWFLSRVETRGRKASALLRRKARPRARLERGR